MGKRNEPFRGQLCRPIAAIDPRARIGGHGSLNYDGNDHFCFNGQPPFAINNASRGADREPVRDP
jgi:hypothetical protein